MEVSMRGFLSILCMGSFIFPSLLNSMSDEEWGKLAESKLNLTPEQSYLLVDNYRGNSESIPLEIYSRAINFLEAKKQKNDRDFFRLSLAYEMIRDYENAMKSISNAISINPKESKYYYTRGRLYSSAGKMKEALYNLSKAIELNSKNSYAYYEMYYLYKNTPELEKSVENFSTFLKTAPESLFKRTVFNTSCEFFVLEKGKEVNGCPSKIDYEKMNLIRRSLKDKDRNEEQISISKKCCEYECETYTTKCCEDSECTDYDYYTGECVNFKCKKWNECTKEKCKCTKLCE